jgi:vitamin K-dependent gamma-carboxylase
MIDARAASGGRAGRPWLERARVLGNQIVGSPVDGASLAAFRILFGVTMAAGAVRFLALGWVDEFYVRPTYHFTWELFPWVRPLPDGLMHLQFVALALLACGIALGLHSRLSAALFCLGFTYVELIDKTTYLNHYYLVSLLSGLLVVLPAHQIWSIDAWRRRVPASPTIPSWTVNLLRFQIAVVFVFAGLAKINGDWLLEAQPLRIWLAARSDVPVVGQFFTQTWVPYVFSWCGAAYDLSIVGLLLWRPTRPIAYVTVIVFHAMTALLFPIGMFPWIMIVATTIFFSPEWPRRWLRRWQGDRDVETGDASLVPRLTLVASAIYMSIQIAVPLRAYWPGTDPEWTSRGFNFSWRVMLAEKAGYTEMVVVESATSKRRTVRMRDYVTERQEKMMAQDPFMVRALARHIAAELRAQHVVDIEVRAESFASLNGRPFQRLIDPGVDLAGPDTVDWIVPLRTRSSNGGGHSPLTETPESSSLLGRELDDVLLAGGTPATPRTGKQPAPGRR